MFTGIIEKTSRVENFRQQAASAELVLSTGFADIALGESIAIQGVCLTVAEILNPREGRALFHISPETIRCTNLGLLSRGQVVNLERSVPNGGRFSGHWVQGHVDGMGRIEDIAQEMGSDSNRCYRMTVSVPENLIRYCIAKGSITINGVSLTINRLLESNRIELQLIPHTWKNTHFSETVVGNQQNIEVDLIAKYVERLCQPYMKP